MPNFTEQISRNSDKLGEPATFCACFVLYVPKYKNPRFPPQKINDCKIKLYFSSFDAIIKKSKPN